MLGFLHVYCEAFVDYPEAFDVRHHGFKGGGLGCVVWVGWSLFQKFCVWGGALCKRRHPSEDAFAEWWCYSDVNSSNTQNLFFQILKDSPTTSERAGSTACDAEPERLDVRSQQLPHHA